ncbi:MAG: pseudouridine synthase, partial [Phycisphaerae bacterium]
LGIPKVYRALVRGQVSRDIVARMKKGVHLADGKATVSEVEIVQRSRQSSVLRITLREGRNRQVRRMLARLDHAVKMLKRIQIGPLRIKGLPVGACRRLTEGELRQLRKAVRSAKSKQEGGKGRRPHRRESMPPAGKAKRSAKRTGEKTGTRPRGRADEYRAEWAKSRRRLVTYESVEEGDRHLPDTFIGRGFRPTAGGRPPFSTDS